MFQINRFLLFSLIYGIQLVIIYLTPFLLFNMVYSLVNVNSLANPG